jgi:hypothetical protein
METMNLILIFGKRKKNSFYFAKFCDPPGCAWFSICVSFTGRLFVGCVIAPVSLKYLLSYLHEAEWAPFQTQYFSENLVAPGMKPRPLDL